MISYPFNIDPVDVIETSSEDEITNDTEGDRHHKRPAVLKSEIKGKPKDDVCIYNFYSFMYLYICVCVFVYIHWVCQMPNNRMPITQKLLLGFDINTVIYEKYRLY